MRVIVTLLLLLVSLVSSQAANNYIKFGNVSSEELNMSIYEPDSSAAAVVLADIGRSHMDYGKDQFRVIFERTKRIKILKKEGLEYANHYIELFKRNGKKESITGIKAITHNLENGKPVKYKMKSSAVFREDIDEKWVKASFTLPNVKVGSVIEFTYQITSDFIFRYQTWYFQSAIPAVWSEYNAEFLEYFTYGRKFQGYFPLSINESSTGSKDFTIVLERKANAGLGGLNTYSETLSDRTRKFTAQTTSNRWVIQNIPAFKPEPYTTCKEDYISKIEFELEKTQYPNSLPKIHSGTWQNVNKRLSTSEWFNGRLNGNLFLNPIAKNDEIEKLDDFEKIETLYKYVQSNYRWNGTSNYFLPNNLSWAHKELEVPSQYINMTLISLLKKAGIDAKPVAVSTRSHGMIKEFKPETHQFNYVVCLATVGEKNILLDATDKSLPMGVLPTRCLNGKGLIIDKKYRGWIDLATNHKYKKKTSLQLSFDEELEASGKIELKFDGYNGFKNKYEYKKKKENSSFVKEAKALGLQIDSINTKNDNSATIILKAHLKNCGDYITNTGEKLYVDLQNKFRTNNPFKLDKRIYPISYSTEVMKVFTGQILIPKGYEVESLPQNVRLALPNKGGMFSYTVSHFGNQVFINSRFILNQKFFLPEEYPILRSFYAQAIAKQEEQVVLKKL